LPQRTLAAAPFSHRRAPQVAESDSDDDDDDDDCDDLPPRKKAKGAKGAAAKPADAKPPKAEEAKAAPKVGAKRKKPCSRSGGADLATAEKARVAGVARLRANPLVRARACVAASAPNPKSDA
jgi:hypothetical protein